jgi:uncharacterized phage-associated protein
MEGFIKNKVENAICYIAKEYKKKARKYISQTVLYKILAFIDFDSVKETGKPAFGLEYSAMENGPVPREIYDKRQDYDTELFRFCPKDGGKFVVIAKEKAKPDLDYFSGYEVELINKLLFIFGDSKVNAGHASKASHERITVWEKAWNRKPNSKIDFAEMFDNLEEKKDLTYPEEVYITYSALKALDKGHK